MLEYVANWTPTSSVTLALPLCAADYEAFLERARDSATGADGLPYRAWACGGATLWPLGQLQSDGIHLPLSYYATLLAFTPRGDADGDDTLCARTCRCETSCAHEQ